MAASDAFRTVAGEHLDTRAAFRYLARAMRLRCPVCGDRPIFIPATRVRRVSDWLQPLDGCPRCGYPYEREPGYFLLAIFGFNLGFAVFVGLTAFISLALAGDIVEMPYGQLLAITVLPIPVINILIARHAKALFIALDHFVDPHIPGDDGSDDDGGEVAPLVPAPWSGDGGHGAPRPVEELVEV